MADGRVTLAVIRAEIAARLDPTARAVATVVWQRRHANERASVTLAERMIEEAAALGLSDCAPALERLAGEERRHVEETARVLEALDAAPSRSQGIREPGAGEPTELSFARDVVVGLAICESVSASRFAAVRAATDLPAFRRLIDGFLRDEIRHALLGFALLDAATTLTTSCLGKEDAERWLVRESIMALAELEKHVGMDGERKGLLPLRAQPKDNPGVVEPNVDALSFYRAVNRRILPKLAATGLPVLHAWRSRFAA